MALVGKRDGRNFGWGRQLSYAGPQALKDMFGGTTVRSRRTEIAGRLSCAGVGRKMGRGLTMREKLISRPCWITPDICVSKLNKGLSASPPRKIGCPA